MLQFHANHVSASVVSNCYQVTFAEEDTDDVHKPYLVIQRQFDDSEDHTCCIETHDRKYCGYFLLRRIEFTPERLLVEIDRPSNDLIGITFRLTPRQYAEASRVMKIISGDIEPEGD